MLVVANKFRCQAGIGGILLRNLVSKFSVTVTAKVQLSDTCSFIYKFESYRKSANEVVNPRLHKVFFACIRMRALEVC